MHFKKLLDRRLADLSLNRIDKIHQADLVAVADIDHAERRYRGQAVARWNIRCTFGTHRHSIDQQTDAAHQILDIGKIAPHIAIVINLDRRAFDDPLSELEQRHVGAAIGAINGEKAKHRHR